jgi:hypothetical protein
MDNDTAGDPMSLKKWSRKSLRNIADQIRDKDIQISINTIAKLLKELGFSLKSNIKEIAETQHPDRNQQFEIIGQLKDEFRKANDPYISVDCKKKETVGNFKNNGQQWSIEFKPVYTHDFRSLAKGIANPYGIYEPLLNDGTVVVGTSYDTPEFAVDSIILWLTNYGFKNYDKLSHLLIFCDCGGSNGYRARAWKYGIYKKICQPFEMTVTVCHYPSGASKWNPIEHRLFSFISLNWAAVPLKDYQTIINYISNTTTRQGLKVNAILNDKTYEKGIKITDKQMNEIKIEKNLTLPQWNYTIYN